MIAAVMENQRHLLPASSNAYVGGCRVASCLFEIAPLVIFSVASILRRLLFNENHPGHRRALAGSTT